MRYLSLFKSIGAKNGQAERLTDGQNLRRIIIFGNKKNVMLKFLLLNQNWTFSPYKKYTPTCLIFCLESTGWFLTTIFLFINNSGCLKIYFKISNTWSESGYCVHNIGHYYLLHVFVYVFVAFATALLTVYPRIHEFFQ